MLLTSLAAVATVGYVASTVLPIRGVHDWIMRGALFRGSPDSIAVTIDDGPHPERTPALLDLFAQTGTKATFFLIGIHAARYPEIVKRIAGEGHVIGNHTWSHPWLPTLSSNRIKSELVRCQEVLETITQQTPRLVRPPYGCRDFRFYRVADRLGLTPVLWSLDSLDWSGAASDVILDRIGRATVGDILLFHDGSPRADGTVSALGRWLRSSACGDRLGALPDVAFMPTKAG